MSEQEKKYPLDYLVDFFNQQFADEHFEYGMNRIGVCRYPLINGHRISETLEDCPHTYGLDGGVADKQETVAGIMARGDTPTSIYFKLSCGVDDIYSSKFSALSCVNIITFFDNINQHLMLIGKQLIYDDTCEYIKTDYFGLIYQFKYETLTNKVSRMAVIRFNQTNDYPAIDFHITDNDLTSQSSMRKINLEIFNRYYKSRIKEAIPDISFEDLYALSDISIWDERLKSLVKMMYY